MYKKHRFLILLVVFNLIALPHIAFCVSSEELALLDMYYTSKDLVSSSTRSVKPVSQVAENISVITAKDIRDMNAHTVDEVLNQVPGLFITYNRDFGGISRTQILGAEDYHTLVLVDGMPWNNVMDNSVKVTGIPVEIIERIEIVKGPASSAWGSALGGVINIMTKHLDFDESPSGTVYGSYGERNTYDIRADYMGNLANTRYFIYAGRQESDGLRSGREFENTHFFSKVNFPIKDTGSLQLSFGYTEPELNLISVPASYWNPWVADWDEYFKEKTLFGNGSLNVWISSATKLSLTFHFFKREPNVKDLYPSSLRALYSEFDDEELLIGGSATLAWYGDNHSLNVGLETNYSDVDAASHWGGGVPSEYYSAHENDWAVFINDTLLYGKWSFTPGIRYDYNSIYGSFVSPSLGVTYQTSRDTLLRCSIAKGFTAPSLVQTKIGGYIAPNPDLDPEEIWSYQAGIESSVFRHFSLKSTFFYHELSEGFVWETQPSGWDMAVNSGSSKRKGVELEVETHPFTHFSFSAGATWVLSSPHEEDSYNMYAYHVKAGYDKKNDLSALLLGQYIQGIWDHDDFIWDLNFSKHLFSLSLSNVWLNFNAHNLFNGRHHERLYVKNPERWLEAGIRIDFN